MWENTFGSFVYVQLLICFLQCIRARWRYSTFAFVVMKTFRPPPVRLEPATGWEECSRANINSFR
jgi:hypothetical protein